jgi:hypothetical protein
MICPERRQPLIRCKPPSGSPQVTFRQPIECLLADEPRVAEWNANCIALPEARRARNSSDQRGQGEPMKIYLLMVLIGAIAAISHLDLKRKAPEPKV